MDRQPGEQAPPARRGRGERAGLDRATIIAAARRIDPGTLTMQSLADDLGVDRKALHHHVNGRDALLEMVAEHVFLERMSATAIPPDADWRDACRVFAAGMRRSLVDSGVLAPHFRSTPVMTLSAIRPAEIVLERMLAAGFSEENAGRALLLLTTVGIGFAREEVADARNGGHPQIGPFRDLLARTPPADLGVLRRLDASGFDAYGDAQFTFDIDAVVAGLEAALPPPAAHASDGGAGTVSEGCGAS
ncbi:TetR/AcrR family transcriptional regulator C-terminal domain-containing protein [Microbacterium sp. 18062]|uniref:TetR/AcrR family transcriptional regulator C-terminal domain-containing protein n=1 Tax=Microbacterium sp. 18062 TaxID=2681410 RepID=UPI001359B2CB|nr:TetR/AcrR family transcriptional regulator C-terminal domain-containing protein [Microbacterium sp. 18062]